MADSAACFGLHAAISQCEPCVQILCGNVGICPSANDRFQRPLELLPAVSGLLQSVPVYAVVFCLSPVHGQSCRAPTCRALPGQSRRNGNERLSGGRSTDTAVGASPDRERRASPPGARVIQHASCTSSIALAPRPNPHRLAIQPLSVACRADRACPSTPGYG